MLPEVKLSGFRAVAHTLLALSDEVVSICYCMRVPGSGLSWCKLMQCH